MSGLKLQIWEPAQKSGSELNCVHSEKGAKVNWEGNTREPREKIISVLGGKEHSIFNEDVSGSVR